MHRDPIPSRLDAEPVAVPAPLPSGDAMDRVVPVSRRGRHLRFALAVAASSIAAFTLWRTWPRGLAVERGDLTIATVAAGTFDDELVLRANVLPAHMVLLDATDGGRVDAVPVADGASVHAGELLYRLSNPQREQEVLARSAEVAQQLSNLSVQRAALAGARAAQRRALAQLPVEQAPTHPEPERTPPHAPPGLQSAAALEDAERRSSLQRQLLDQSRADGEAEMRTREQSLRELERAVAGLQDGLRLVRQAAAGLAARAPTSGRLAGFALQVGASVHPGDHLGRIDEAGGFKLAAQVDEYYRGRLRAGLAASVAPPVASAALSLARIQPQISNGQVGIELEFRGAAPPALQVGQGMDVHLVLGPPGPALLLEDGPFYGDSGGAWVFVLDADGTAATRREVQLGRRAAGRIEVIAGLRAGDRVVTSAVRRYGDARRLRIADPLPSASGTSREIPMIKLRQLSKLHHTGVVETTALDRIDLDIEAGEYVAITGPSGCGKSTLLGILGLLDVPSSGDYWFDGQNVAGWNETRLTRLRRGRIGFVFQSFNLIDDLSVAENIELALEYGDVPPRQHRARVDEAMARLGIAHRASHRPSQLSGGQQQRVAIARAVVSRPALLLADEPTGNLDSAHGDEVMRILRELNAEGTTLAMVTHSPLHAAQASRTLRLLDGRILIDALSA